MGTPRSNDLPNLFIIGAQKAGTTMVWRYLSQHPDVHVPLVKEVSFFIEEAIYAKGLGFYRSEFYPPDLPQKCIVDASIQYLTNPVSAERIARDLPSENHRFIVMLREPVSRTYSSYWQTMSEGAEDLSFEAALAAEDARIAQGKATGERWWRWAYVHASLYATNLERYFHYFDRSRFLILLQEDLKTPRETMRRIFEFAGVDPDFEISLEGRANPASLPRSKKLQKFVRKDNPMLAPIRGLIPRRYRTPVRRLISSLNQKQFDYPPMAPEIRQRLQERFRPEIERLGPMIGRDLSHWLTDKEPRAELHASGVPGSANA